MYTKTIKFEDYDGNEREETFLFNLNKSELMMWLMTSGDYTLDKVLMRLMEERNGKKLMETIEDLIHRSYGRKSLDGRRFEKSEEIWRDFRETEAYSELFYELSTDAKKCGEFVNGIIPKKLAEEMAKTIDENPNAIPDSLKDYVNIEKK